jgi:CDP-diacylglycerol--serine O-phosphatidyltransferase
VQNEIGVQLDSLADMITSGAVPGAVIFVLLNHIVNENLLFSISKIYNYLPYFGFIITSAAAYRLAKFNVDLRQKDGFIGVPTPAMSMFVVSIPLVILHSKYAVIVNLVQTKEFLIFTVLIFSYLMNSNFSIFALKFKSFDWKSNWIKYVFIGMSFLLIGIFKVVAIPMAVILYILLSVIVEKRVERIN